MMKPPEKPGKMAAMTYQTGETFGKNVKIALITASSNCPQADIISGYFLLNLSLHGPKKTATKTAGKLDRSMMPA